jgi:alpha-galactosidase
MSGNEKDYFALDPRYKEVRHYLSDTYERAVRQWGLDGLKLDFIDSFVLRGKSLEIDSRRDTESLEDALHFLMSDVTKKLRALNPDILIEFRQLYIGPSICKYGNMLRVADCPADYFSNRSQIIDMRLTSGETAVHSDMLMWNKNESAEGAALQIANCIFGVPQISVKIKELPDTHIRMLKFYLDFCLENREVLLNGKLTAKDPANSYSQAKSTLGNKSVVAVYTDPVVELNSPDCIVVNAGTKKSIIVKAVTAVNYNVVNCLGNIISEGIIDAAIAEIPVPVSGIVFFTEAL